MRPIVISDKFDGGNISVIDASDPLNIQLAIKPDNASDFFQWFYFRLEGEVGQTCRVHIANAGQASYTDGWKDYAVCTSWSREDWFRTPTEYNNGVLSFDITLEQNAVYFAFFQPFSHERHLDLLSWAQEDARLNLETLGQTLDGHAMSLLHVCGTDTPKHTVWLIARQHPGETMAEWFIEGLLEALLDRDNSQATQLLQTTEFYIVPNMNPDGSVRGNLRTNAAGANLNREWQTPTMDHSPEVFLVREKMLAVGGDLFLDIHGDEALPYNFVAGCEGNPSYNDYHARLECVFKEAFMQISADFQDQVGYPKTPAGKANMTIAANWLGEHFNTLSFTIEMPFKDNANLPNPRTGWSASRSAQLGKDVLFPIRATLAILNK
ncbi:MAG: carboxypeptidase family protein [Cellvibrionales bacterium]|nr:carboxypeptidase family protein [Cellvibrionales bacterium]